MMNIKFDLKILVVDDIGLMRKTVRNNLADLGLKNVYEAPSGLMAWSMLQDALKENQPYELIISDWNMPRMTGLELLRKVREKEELKHLPFLMITSESEPAQVVTAVKAGVSNFIIKPIVGYVFKEKLEKMFTPT